jgi:hypothetical protein
MAATMSNSRSASKPAAAARLDRWAMWVSAACVAHCLATTVFIAALSAAGGLLGNPLIHEVGLAIAILLGAVAFGRGVAVHRRALPMALGIAGLSTMTGALVIGHPSGHVAESAMTIVGVSILALGHAANRRAALA